MKITRARQGKRPGETKQAKDTREKRRKKQGERKSCHSITKNAIVKL